MKNYYLPRKRIVEPETSKQFTICGRDIDTFYYNIPKEQRGITNEVTPNKGHIRPSKPFTGKHHPTCKIRFGKYNDLNVSETQIKYKTNIIYNPSDVKSIREINEIDPILAVSMLVCQFHSLNKRLTADIKRINNGFDIDFGHMKAAYTIIQNVNQSLDILYILHENNKFKEEDFQYDCIMNSINLYFGDVHIIKRLYDMIRDYNKIYNNVKYRHDIQYKNRVIDFINKTYMTEYKQTITPTPSKLIKRSRNNVNTINRINTINNSNNIQNKEPQNINKNINSNSNKKAKINIQRSSSPKDTTKKRLAFQQINNNKI